MKEDVLFRGHCSCIVNPYPAYCKLEPETIIHLFFNCPQTTTFWKDLEHLINSRCFETSFSICAKTIIFGDNRASDVLNIILIMAKYYIFKHKENSQPLSVDAFKNRNQNITKRKNI